MNKAIIIGHDSQRKGAFSEFFGLNEYDFYLSMIDHLNTIGDVYLHNHEIGSYTNRMRETAEAINQTDYDMVLALHFNAFNGSAKGCEALFISQRGGEIANNFCHHYTKKTGAVNRGAKQLNNNSRGWAEIFYPKAPAVILEPFFGDNEDDCKLFDRDKFLECLKCL